MTLWESEEALNRGAEAVEQARAATIQAMGGAMPPAEVYEILASDL